MRPIPPVTWPVTEPHLRREQREGLSHRPSWIRRSYLHFNPLVVDLHDKWPDWFAILFTLDPYPEVSPGQDLRFRKWIRPVRLRMDHDGSYGEERQNPKARQDDAAANRHTLLLVVRRWCRLIGLCDVTPSSVVRVVPAASAA